MSTKFIVESCHGHVLSKQCTICWISSWRNSSIPFLYAFQQNYYLMPDYWQNARKHEKHKKNMERQIRFIVNESLQKLTLVTGLSSYLLYYGREEGKCKYVFSSFGSSIHSFPLAVRCSTPAGKWILLWKWTEFSYFISSVSINCYNCYNVVRLTLYFSWNIKWTSIKMFVLGNWWLKINDISVPYAWIISRLKRDHFHDECDIFNSENNTNSKWTATEFF